LGYVGVDIVIDRDSGILVMEVNKRPGLEIQIANRAGLSKRLKFIEKNNEGDRMKTEAKVKQAIEWDLNGWE
jgi:glutathione synthase/RimK-type ligase-like ATP-grasp enzyme